tara:strand:- start:248 stop:1075 length:828 start_codon:yes stop_codon:yes gene_type:complete
VRTEARIEKPVDTLQTRRFPWPIGTLRMSTGIVFIYGGPGTGKTTIGLQFEPTFYFPSEQSIDAISARLSTVSLSADKEWHGKTIFRHNLDNLPGDNDLGNVVIDSITEFGGGLDTFKRLQVIAKKRIVIVIAQETKSGEYRGAAEMPHLSDACVDLSVDKDLSVNVAVCWKNRTGPTWTRYYSLAEGICKPGLNGRYTAVYDGNGFRLIPEWDRSPWHHKREEPCYSYIAIDPNRKPLWTPRAAAFAHEHDMCFFHGDEVHHHPECLSADKVSA